MIPNTTPSLCVVSYLLRGDKPPAPFAAGNEQILVLPAGQPDHPQASRDANVLETAEDDLGTLIATGAARVKADVLIWHHGIQPLDPDICRQALRLMDGAEPADAVYLGSVPNLEATPWAALDELPRNPYLVRRSVLDAIGPPSSAFGSACSYEYLLRMIRAGLHFRLFDTVSAIPEPEPELEHVVQMLKQVLGYLPASWAARLARSNQGGGPTDAAFAAEYSRLLCAYNGDMNTHDLLMRQAPSSPHASTATEMRRLMAGCSPVTKVSADTFRLLRSYDSAGYPEKRQAAEAAASLIEDQGKPTVYYIGRRHLMFDGHWRKAALARAWQTLLAERERRSTDICIIVGNGPSLNAVNLDLLAGHDVFISNYAVLSPRLLAHAKYVAVTNYLVAEQGPHHFNALRNVKKVFPYWLRYCIHEDDDTVFLNAQGGEPFFSTDILDRISWHSTVTHFHLQLAYWLGYRRVLMIGFDHSYVQSAGVKEGDILECEKDDPNHFDPNYFKGKKWQAADVDRMESMYRMGKEAFESDGRMILNCTVGGRLELFKRSRLESELGVMDSVVLAG